MHQWHRAIHGRIGREMASAQVAGKAMKENLEELEAENQSTDSERHRPFYCKSAWTIDNFARHAILTFVKIACADIAAIALSVRHQKFEIARQLVVDFRIFVTAPTAIHDCLRNPIFYDAGRQRPRPASLRH
jgi:hypothetical protein